MRGYLTDEQKRLAFSLRASGWRLVDIAREVGCTAPMVGLMVREGKFTQGVPHDWEPRAGCLTITDREQILLGIGRGDSLTSIARALSRSPSTITREVKANGGAEHYSAWHARQQARRPKPASFDVVGCTVRSVAASSSSGRPRRSPAAYRWTILTTPSCV